MNRRMLLAIALGSTLTTPMFNVYADGDEKSEPPQARLIVSEGDEEKKQPEQPQFRAHRDEAEKAGSQLILSDGDDEKKDPSKPELLLTAARSNPAHG